MQIDQRPAIKDALLGLLKKYGVRPSFTFQLNREAIGEEGLQLLPGWEFAGGTLNPRQVPLLTWRTKRSVIELKNIVGNNIIEDVCLIRCCAFVNSDWTLKALLYREFDLVEYIAGHKIISLHAGLTDKRAGNIIARLANGALCSIEASVQLPKGNPTVERHELIARRGVASDLLVDAQTPQHSIYYYTEDRERRYTDTDMELFGYEPGEIDHIRAAFQAISDPSLIEQWSAQHQHLQDLLAQVFASDKKLQTLNPIIR